ncbi:MAG TPA: glycosyltransferase family A protein [Burkholderiaceae bacterium]|nr:glycosyltransferase family A protein [Burkholderiaceae bacterium]
MRTTVFSLILATVRRTKELDRLFNTLAAQTFLDFEVIVVDQNIDNRLTPHLERASSLGIVVKHIKHHPPNLAAARNAGIEIATGEWLGFPDDDCWYDARTLEKLTTCFKSSKKPAGVIIRWAEQGEPPVAVPQLSWLRSRAFRDIPVSSITLFIQRDLFDRVGGFDPRFGVGQWFGAAEETDLVFRILQANALVAYEPAAKVHHSINSDQSVADPQARFIARCRARGTGALYAKHGLPAWVILRGLAAPVLRPLLRGEFGTGLAHGCAITLGRLDGLLGWKRRHQ